MKNFVINSELIDEWNWDKNSKLGLYPDKTTLCSDKKAWWICHCGHEWETKVSNRHRGCGCPYCSNQMVLQGYNDLQTTHPHLVCEWDCNKNGKLLPTMVPHGTTKKVWWKCQTCNYEWQTTVNSRARGCGCPQCSKIFKTSSQEMELYYYIKKYFSDAISGYSDKTNNIFEIDIYIPSLRVGIEYDGEKWHKDVYRDKKKDETCSLCGITMLRVREPKCPKYDSNARFFYLDGYSEKYREEIIFAILCSIGICDADINLERDFGDIQNLRRYKNVSKSLLRICPQIAAEWHPTKNGNLTPDNVSYSSDKKVWWQCAQCDNEWSAAISDRTRAKGCSCPRCGREKVRKSKCKPVYCIELDKEFESGKKASIDTGVNHHGILNCASGKQESAGRHPATGEKLHWVFV